MAIKKRNAAKATDAAPPDGAAAANAGDLVGVKKKAPTAAAKGGDADAGKGEQKSAKSEEEGGDGNGALVCAMLVLVLGIVAATTMITVYSAEDMQFADMPGGVQAWMEQGHYIPVRVDGKDQSVFVAKMLSGKEATETVLLVPDVHTSSYSYRTVAKELHAKGMHVVVFDFPGLGLSKTPPLDQFVFDTDSATTFIAKLFKAVSLRSVHLVLQGASASAGVTFAQANRAKVRSITFAGVDAAGQSIFTTPPLFDSKFGHALCTKVPVVNWMTLAWFKSKAATAFTPDLLQDYTFLNGYNDGEESYLAALRGVEALHAKDAPAPCDGNHADGDAHDGHNHNHHGHVHNHADGDGSGPDGAADSFPTQVADLFLPAMTVWVDAADQKLWTSKKKIGYSSSSALSLGFPTEDQPKVFADVLAKFVLAQEPTPKAEAPPIPAHVQAQLDAGHGHTHGHGGGGGHHGHSHGH